MKLLATAAALTAVAVPAAPAAGAEPGHPFDFELAPRPTASAAAAGRVVSERLPTGRRFNLVGMHWRGRAEPGISVRVRRPAGAWSRWQALDAHADHNPDPAAGERLAASSDPLWVGAADAVQYRLSRPVPGVRLHFVNVGRRARTRLRTAQAAGLSYVTRSQWGASQCRPREAPLYGQVDAVEVHHTVSLNDYSRAEAPAIVLAICRYHRNSNGWNDIGYNALVDKYGVLYEGRAGGLDQAVVGAHAQGFNSETAGIASIGDHTSVAAGPATMSALARYIAWKLTVHGLPLSGSVTLRSAGGSESRYGAGARVTVDRVLGHRDTGRTACPGALLYGQLDELRAMVAGGAGGVPTSTARLSAALARHTIDFGEEVPVSGLLTGPDGLPLGSAPVEVQTNADGALAHLEAADHRGRRHVRERAAPTQADVRAAALPGRSIAGRRHLGAPAAAPAAGDRAAPPGEPRPAQERAWRSRARWRRASASSGVLLQQRVRGRYRTVGAKAVPNARRALLHVLRAGVPGALPLRRSGEVRRRHRPRLHRLARAAGALTHQPCLRSSE